MRIVVKKAGHYPELKEVRGTLENLKEIVGGYIECIQISNNIICVCNEEGKLMGLTPNFIFNDDIIVGDVFFCAGAEEELTSLSTYDANWLMNVLTLMEMKREK